MDSRGHSSQRELHSSNAPPSAPPLNLKVMRLSRPNLSHSSQPFFDPASSSELDTHARASLLSSGAYPPQPLATEVAPTTDGADTFHPESMVGFPLSSLLILPGSFGAISLGETFTSSINVSNDTAFAVEGATLKVEIQAGNGGKNLLAEVGPKGEGDKADGGRLASGDALGTIIRWEIKELGTHMLVCEVGWVDQDAQPRSFRKVYKFQVTNPLSVKTKVHLPSTPTTTLSPSLRHLVYLELHIQNTSPAPLFFSKMLFEPAQGLTFKSLNDDDGLEEGKSVFEATPLLNPGDTRQVCFVIDERGREGGEVGKGMKRSWEPGTALPLGRMDLNWNSSNGEPGRLVTSTLHRRVPVPPAPPAPVPAPQPPLLRTSSLSSPTPRQHRSLLSPQPPTPQSLPGTPPPPPPPKDTAPPTSGLGEGWEVDLVVLDQPADAADPKVEESFSRTIKVMVLPTLSGSSPTRIELRFLTPPAGSEATMLLPLGPSVRSFNLDADVEGVQVKEMEVEYVPLEEGLMTLGGVGVWVGSEGEERELRRWESLGEVWVGR